MRASKPHLELTRDAHGQEVLLKEGKFQVMMEWEKPYMEACIDALKPVGDVLEIGFGCGYSAARIQQYHPKSHTIVECDPVVAELARAFAMTHSHVIVIEATWQEVIDTLGVFDTIFFDDYPLETEAERAVMQEGAHACSAVIQEGKDTLSQMQATLEPHLPKAYRNEDLLEFFDLIRSQKGIEAKTILVFLDELTASGQITLDQKAFAVQTALLQGLLSPADIEAFIPKGQLSSRFVLNNTGDRLFAFLGKVLDQHMRQGSRFSCFLEDPTSKFEHPLFFDQIITNPYLDYTEQWIPITVPAHCQYYQGDTALVITITKMASAHKVEVTTP